MSGLCVVSYSIFSLEPHAINGVLMFESLKKKMQTFKVEDQIFEVPAMPLLPQ
jgi:hypothetical protein